METQSVSSNSQLPTATELSEASSDPKIGSDFETFLRMLTAQIQNQDPLNPMDSSEYAVQLATFSSVEQQVLTNDLLKQIAGSDSFSQLGEVAAWVGMEALVPDPRIDFSGAPVDLHFKPDLGAASSQIVVTNDKGAEVGRRTLTDKTSPMSFDGRLDDGRILRDGTYSFALAHTSPSGETTLGDLSSYVSVSEVRATSTGSEIVLSDGRAVSKDAVTGLRSP